MWLGNAVRVICAFAVWKGAAGPATAVLCPAITSPVSWAGSSAHKDFTEPVQLTNSRKMVCFLCQVKSNEPQSHQLRNVAKAREGWWQWATRWVWLCYSNPWFLTCSKYLCLLGQQEWYLATRKRDFKYKRPDSAPGSTSCHHLCLYLFVTQKFEFLWKLIWNLLPRRTRTANCSTLGYQNLAQRMLQSSASQLCLQPKANFTHCF